MADDSIEIDEKLDFHSCDTPRGCTYFNLGILTKYQQHQLNELKLWTIKSNEKYLRRHPEIRAFVSLITRWVLRKRPRRDVLATIQEFFHRPRQVIDAEVEAYIANRRKSRDVDEEEELINDEEDDQQYSKQLSTNAEVTARALEAWGTMKAEEEEEEAVCEEGQGAKGVDDEKENASTTRLEEMTTTEFIRWLLEEHQRGLPLGDVDARRGVAKGAAERLEASSASVID